MAELDDYSCPCPTCGAIKHYKAKVSKKNLLADCMDCSLEKRTIHKDGEKRTYTRVCKCGDIKEVGYKPKGNERCRKCAKKEDAKEMARIRWGKVGRIRYFYFCPTCPKVSEVTIKRKTSWCGDCSRLYSKTKPSYSLEWDYDTMRYFRICKHCGDIKQVKQEDKCGLKACNECRHLEIDKKVANAKRKATNEAKKKANPKPKVAKKPKRAEKKINPIALAKVREVNRKHKEEEARKKTKPKVKAKLTDEQMMAKWLKGNKVTKLEDNKISGLTNELEFGG